MANNILSHAVKGGITTKGKKKIKEHSEDDFKKLCNKNNYWWIKLQVDKSKIMLGLYQGTPMPADFLVATSKGCYLVEVKEILKGTSFPFERLTQETKLHEAKLTKGFVECYVFFNFVEHDTYILIPIYEFVQLHKKAWLSGKSSITLKDMEKYTIDDLDL